MAIENEEVDDVQNNNEQQNNEQTQQVNEQASTGDAKWDKIIDDVAGLKTGAQDDSGKTVDDKSKPQLDKDGKPIAQTRQPNAKEQQDANATQRGQSNAQDQSTQQVRTSARKFGNLFQSDAQGNIYDSRGGLIAKQGGQRAIFHRLYPTIEAQERELVAHRQTIKNYTEANEIAKREGLTLDEHGAALQMFASYKKDPAKTLNTLLTLMEQSGRDVSSIRQATGPSIADFRAAVQEEVAKAVQPFSFLTAQQQEQKEHNELPEQVATDYAAFMEEFPDAKMHEGALANVMRDKQVSNREAYYMVRAFAAERGLDWNKPLAEQLVAKQQDRKPSGEGNNRHQLPNMGGRNVSETTHVEEGAMDQANANDSWDSIARKAMAKHGIQI